MNDNKFSEDKLQVGFNEFTDAYLGAHPRVLYRLLTLSKVSKKLIAILIYLIKYWQTCKTLRI
jgi:hypothetical protein